LPYAPNEVDTNDFAAARPPNRVGRKRSVLVARGKRGQGVMDEIDVEERKIIAWVRTGIWSPKSYISQNIS